MSTPVTLQQVFNLSVGRVDARKMQKLEQMLERALGCSLSSQVIDDPMLIRRQLVESMRSQGVGDGAIQAFEQFFMGLVRRAAVEGLGRVRRIMP